MAGTELEPIAVIGVALRVPGARTPEQLWRNLRAGVASISWFSRDELRARGAPEVELASPDFVPAAGVIDDADRFDAALFGLSDREAELTHPEKRIFLECAWAALEHAGHDPARAAAPIGVFATATSSGFLLDNLPRVGDAERGQVFGRDLAALTSERLGLTGPSLTIEGVCSASLVATHVACQALLAGECGIALAGGASLSAPHRWGYLPGGELSPDGHCRSFDADAQGAVPGDGVGVLVLRRLRDAERDGDTIHGVIRGSALNHTGGARIGIAGQVALVTEAMAIAEVDPRSLGHVELHGNGLLHEETVEIRVLTEAFRKATADRGFCTIGSVKPNLGHAGPATGMAMLTKVLAMLRAGERPPNLFVRRPNPLVRLEATPFRLTAELAPWPSDGDARRRAGVGVFGNGMCNAYLVLEDASPPPARAPGRDAGLLVLCAHTRAALAAIRAQLRAHLLDHPDDDPADVAFTLHTGRRALAPRSPGTSTTTPRSTPIARRAWCWCAPTGTRASPRSPARSAPSPRSAMRTTTACAPPAARYPTRARCSRSSSRSRGPGRHGASSRPACTASGSAPAPPRSSPARRRSSTRCPGPAARARSAPSPRARSSSSSAPAPRVPRRPAGSPRSRGPPSTAPRGRCSTPRPGCGGSASRSIRRACTAASPAGGSRCRRTRSAARATPGA